MQLPNHLPHPPRWIVAHTLVPACTTVLLWVSSPYQVTLAKAVAAFLLACHLRAFGPRKFMKVQSVTPLFSATGPWLSTLDAVDFLRSEEHTSELQSRFDLVCRLLLEKKKK